MTVLRLSTLVGGARRRSRRPLSPPKSPAGGFTRRGWWSGGSRRSCASSRGDPSYANHVQSNLRETNLRPDAVRTTIVWSRFFPVAALPRFLPHPARLGPPPPRG